MKNLLLILLVNFFCVALDAQTEKGNFLLGLSGNGRYSEITTTYFQIAINPIVGKLVAKNVAITTDLNFSYTHQGLIWQNSYNQSLSVGIAPGLLFFLPVREKFFITPQLKAGYRYLRFNSSSPNNTDLNNFHQLKLAAGPGFAWFATPYMAVTADFPYEATVYLNGRGNTYGIVNMRFGLLFSIPPKIKE